VGSRAAEPAYAVALAGALGAKGIVAVLRRSDTDDRCSLGLAIASASRTGRLDQGFRDRVLSKDNRQLGDLMRCGEWDIDWAVRGAHLLLKRDDLEWSHGEWVEPDEPGIAVRLLIRTPGAAAGFAASYPRQFAELLGSGPNKVLIETIWAEKAAARDREASLAALESVLLELKAGADLTRPTALSLARFVVDNMAGIAECVKRDALDRPPSAGGLNLSPQTLERSLAPLMDDPAARKAILDGAAAGARTEMADAMTTTSASLKALAVHEPPLDPAALAESIDLHFLREATKNVAAVHGVLARASGRDAPEAKIDFMKFLTSQVLGGAGTLLGRAGAAGTAVIGVTGEAIDAGRALREEKAADEKHFSQEKLEQEMRKGVRDLVVVSLSQEPEVWARLTVASPPPAICLKDGRLVMPQMGSDAYSAYDTWLAEERNPLSRIMGNLTTDLTVHFHL
jgi:hypothetical protein